MQNYRNIEASDIVRDSRETINNNIKTAISCNSGTAFPVDDVEIGMLCYRTDKGALYQMTSLHTWTRVVLDSTIDTSLSTSSTNPVTNKAITTGINSVSTALSDFEDVVADTYAKTSNLATVATSGNYNDLSNKPTTNQVYQAVSTSTGMYYPLLTAQASAATSTLSKCSTMTVQPSTGNITCGTVNGVDVTQLARKGDVPTRTTLSITLASSSWSEGKYTLTTLPLNANSTIFFDVPVGTTAENFNAIQKAKIVAASQSMETLVLQAMGTVPTIDTQITLVVID